jgi:bacterioferritin-associated ferredoxin
MLAPVALSRRSHALGVLFLASEGERNAGMIVCSCAIITDKDVAAAVSALRTADPFVVLTPGLIYRHLSKRPSCGNCLPLITKLMVAYDEEGPSAAPSLPQCHILE